MNQELHNAKCYVDGKLLGVVDITFSLQFNVDALNALIESKVPPPLLCAIAYQFSKS